MKMVHKTLACAAMALTGLPGLAQADDAVVRGVIGLGTAIILNEMNRNRQAQPRPRAQAPRQGTSSRSTRRQPTAEERMAAENRKEVQRRLNLLGFNVGTADGVYGPRTRNAIASFQSSIGHSPSGRITQEQIAILHQQTGGGQSAPGGQGFSSFAVGGQSSQHADAAGQNAFPPLGGEAQPGQPAGGFPALGMQQETGAGGAAASPFPALGAPVAGAGNAGATAFPGLGAPVAGAGNAGATAFPGLGAPAAGAGDAGASAFPSLGAPVPPAPGAQQMPAIGQPGEPAQQAGFPAIGTPAAPAPLHHGFPQMAQPETAPDQRSMPAISAPEESAASMPPIAAVAVEAGAPEGAELQFRTLDTELGRMPFDKDDQPAVVGISLGQSLDEALLAVTGAGFTDCADATPQGTSHCSRQTDSLGDELSIAATPDGEVWSVARTIRFASPVPMASLTGLFGESYPQMMEQASSTKWLSSGPLCAGAMAEPDLSAAVAGIGGVLAGEGEAIPDDLMHFANRCPLLYSLDFAESSGTVSSVVIRFVNATVIDEVRRELDEAEAENLKAVTNDLKL